MATIDVGQLLRSAAAKAAELGLEVDRQGSIILDEKMVFHVLSEALREKGVIYTSIREAVREYPDILEEYGLKRVDVDLRRIDDGVLIYIPRNTRVTGQPLYTCFTLTRRGYMQRIYNLIVIDKGGEAVSAKGCFSLIDEGSHSAVTEIVLLDDAKLSNIMIHSWRPENRIYGSTVATLHHRSRLYDYFIALDPPRVSAMNTTVFLEGGDSAAESNSIVVGRGSAKLTHTTIAYLDAPGSTAEIVSRMLGLGEASISMNAVIEARARDTKGHIECQGLQLSDKAALSTTPVLRSRVTGAELTHEASIGKISEEQLEYLEARGFSPEEATHIIIRGFLELGIEHIPGGLKPIIENVLERMARSSM